MMDGGFILSSSVFLLSVCITQMSPVTAVLFNPANSSHLSSIYTGRLCSPRENQKALSVHSQSRRNTSGAAVMNEYLTPLLLDACSNKSASISGGLESIRPQIPVIQRTCDLCACAGSLNSNVTGPEFTSEIYSSVAETHMHACIIYIIT